MSANSTIYDIGIRYSMDDRASTGLMTLGQAADTAAKKTAGLHGTLGRVAAVFGAGLLGAGAKKAFIDFNSEIEQAQVGIAAISTMFNKGMSMDEGMAQAKGFFEFYQQEAKRSLGETMDFVNMHKEIAPALEKAGASMKDFKTIVTGATTSAPIFGERADVVALDIKQMIAGTVGARDRVASSLISMMGMAVSDFNAKAKANPQFALDVLGQAFGSKALNDARTRMEHTMGGALSTLKDNISLSLGKAGAPLFAAVRDTLNDINNWIDQHPKQIEDWVDRIGSGLKTGFDFMRTAFQFVVDNREVLTDLATTFLAIKGFGMASGFIKGNLGGLATSIEALRGAATGAATSFGSVATSATGVVGALAALYEGLSLLAELIDSEHKKFVVKQGDTSALIDHINNANQILPFARAAERSGDNKTYQIAREDSDKALGTIVETMHQWGAFTKDAQIDWEKFRKQGMEAGLTPEAFNALGPLVDEGFKRFQNDGSIARRLGLHFDKNEDKRKKPQPVNVNINSVKIEVASEHPDRFAFGLQKMFGKVARNPNQARDALRGGL